MSFDLWVHLRQLNLFKTLFRLSFPLFMRRVVVHLNIFLNFEFFLLILDFFDLLSVLFLVVFFQFLRQKETLTETCGRFTTTAQTEAVRLIICDPSLIPNEHRRENGQHSQIHGNYACRCVHAERVQRDQTRE